MDEKSSKESTKVINCPICEQKIHCSQIEDTEVFNLSENNRLKYCLNKCLAYKQHIKNKDKE